MKKNYEGVACAFAHYKDGELLGYRSDTFGTLSERPKIYTYSEKQVEICLRWIREAIKEGGTRVGERLAEKIKSPAVDMLIEGEKKIHEKLKDAKVFEVRVVVCPEYPKEFDVERAMWVRVWDYPIEEINEWIKSPKEHEVIETHYFALDNQLIPN